jgi:hypothetical protein
MTDKIKINCDYCNKDFNDSYIEKHKTKCKNEKIFSCEFCKKKLSTKFNLQEHIKNCKQKINDYKTNLENEITDLKEKMENILYNNKMLKKKNKTLSEFENKVKQMQEENTLLKSTIQELEMKNRDYEIEKKYDNEKYKELIEKVIIPSHIHIDEKPYKCDFNGCTSQFSTSDSLATHKKTHIDEKPYKCDFDGCNSEFKTSFILLRHKKAHTGEKPYKCDFNGCNVECSLSHHLVRHKRTHTGENPYKCEFDGCNSQFKSSSELSIHNRIHTGDKPYKCDLEGCNAEFAQSSGLTSHKKSIHTEEGKRRQKKSEHNTFSYLEEHIKIKREHQVDFSCNGGTFCRLDGLSLHKNKNGQGFIIAHENDEQQHEGYPISCDARRMIEVKSAFIQEGNYMPLVFLRFNPDAFRIDGQIQKIKKKDRLKRYVELVKELENSEDLMPFTVYYLYYDITDNKLNITCDTEYPIELKDNVEIVY